MKHLKTFENTTYSKFEKGELVYYPKLDKIYKIISVYLSSEIFDKDLYYDEDIYVYRLEDDEIGRLNFDWINEDELVKPTKEQLENYYIQKNINKYNL